MANRNDIVKSRIHKCLKPLIGREAVLTILIVLFYLVLWMTFNSTILLAFDKHILPYLDLNNSWPLKGFVTILLIVFVVNICKMFKYKSTASNIYISVLFCLTITLIYYRVIDRYNHYSFISVFTYSDVIIVCGLCYVGVAIINLFRVYFTENTIEPNPFYDIPICGISEDVLGYSAEAERLAEFITSLPVPECWSIGVTAEWGAGKTSFLNLVKQYLPTDKFEIVEFNPRDSKTAETIQEDFFNVLCSSLSKYQPSLSVDIRKYMAALNLIDNRNVIEKILSVYRCFDRTTTRKKIDDTLKKLPKRVIVFIDDFDRLLESEIIEIFKLLDTNASFGNMVFLTAYDKDHVHKLTGAARDNGHTDFEDKFFNYEMTLPVKNFSRLYGVLKALLLKHTSTDKQSYEEISAKINLCQAVFRDYLHTLRDVKRFALLFIRDYEQVSGEVDYQDFLLISLIKYKYPKEYDIIYNGDIFDGPAIFGTNDYITVKEDIAKDRNMSCIPILSILFPSRDSHAEYRFRRINERVSFPMYFSHSFNQNIKLKEMRDLLDKDVEDVKSVITEWYNKKIYSDFTDFINEKSEDYIRDTVSLNRYLKLLVYLASFEMDRNVQSQLYHMLCTSTVDKYKSVLNVEGYKQTIIGFLKQYPDAIRFFINLSVNYDDSVRISEIVYSKQEVNDLIRSEFDRYIANCSSCDEGLMSRLYGCIVQIEPNTRKVTLDALCCKKAKIIIEKGPDYYITSFVRLGMVSSNPNYNSLTVEPFWRQIFETDNNFETFLRSEKCQKCAKIREVKEFWNIYRDNEFNAVEITDMGDVAKLLHDGMTPLFSEYHRLKDLENQFRTLNDSIRKDYTVKEYQQLKSKVCILLDKMQGLLINIKRTDSLRKNINELNVKIENGIAHHRDVKYDEISVLDFVRIKENIYQTITDKVFFRENVFVVEDKSTDQIKLRDVEEFIKLTDLEYIPIDGVSDKSIYFDPIVMASIVLPGQPIPVHHTDYSYYIEALKRCTDENGVSEYENVRNFEYVHQVQQYLRNKFKHEDLRINYTYKTE